MSRVIKALTRSYRGVDSSISAPEWEQDRHCEPQSVNVVRSEADAQRETIEGQNKMNTPNQPQPRILGEGRITFEAYVKQHFPQEVGRTGWEWNNLPPTSVKRWAAIEQAVIDAYQGEPSRTAVLPVQEPHKAE